MAEQEEKKQHWVGYPKPVKGPDVPYSKKEDSNPVFSGTSLVIGGWLYVMLLFALSFSVLSWWLK